MRLAFVAVIVAIVVAIWSATGVSADPGVTLDHAAGPASENFVFTGAGFEPGTVLRAKYLTPAGKEYGFTAGYGEATFVAGSDGTWQLSFSPSTERTSIPVAFLPIVCPHRHSQNAK